MEEEQQQVYRSSTAAAAHQASKVETKAKNNPKEHRIIKTMKCNEESKT